MKLATLLTALMLTAGLTAYSQEIKVVGVGTSMMKKGAETHDGVPKNYSVLAPGMYDALYSYTMKTSDQKDGAEVEDNYLTILQIGEQQAVFGDYASYRTDSLSAAGAPAEAIREAQDREAATEYYFVPRLLLNSPEGKMSVTDVAAITIATYTEPFGTMEWELTEETDTIAGYPATKATTSYGGRDWEAWYTEEIPSSFGPWKLAGLPGLIVKARDTEGIHQFELVSFKQSDTPLMAVKDARVMKIDRDKFIAQRNKVYEARVITTMIDPSSIRDMAVKKGVGDWGAIWINGVQLRNMGHKQIPLELK